MPTLPERVEQLERIINDGLSPDQFQFISSLSNNDLIIVYSNSLEKSVSITSSNLINLIGSGGITFENEFEVDGVTPTGNTLIKQQGVTQVVIGKTAKSNQYSDLDGKPLLATEEYVDNAIDALEYNFFAGEFDPETNTPELSDDTGFSGVEYIVNGALSGGTDFDFSDDLSNVINLKDDDVIIYDGVNWIKKIDNNQGVDTLVTIPQSVTAPVSSNTLNDRMRRIFNLSGYRISSQIEGVNSVGSITTPVFCILADGSDRYLLVDFSLLSAQDQNLSDILSNEGNFFILNSARNSNLLNNDFIGEIKNQCLFSTDVLDSISGITVPSNFTIFEIKESFATFFSGSETQLISIDFVGSETYVEKTYTFTDQDFLSASPITLEPALGVDTIYELSELSASQNLTTAYSNNSFLVITQGVNYATIVMQLTQTGKYYFKSGGLSLSGGDGTIGTDIQNKPLQLSVSSDAINGVGEIKIRTKYRVRKIW